ncbi:MAG: hypothetical protein NTW95_12685 [Candidatus Aminicenantes bacterium]|nr:hypothetical protein [Candidatus Aminicenantes bacterium]
MKKADLLPILKVLREAGIPFALAGGPIDLEDAKSILEIMKGKLDMKYLEGELKRCRLSLDGLTNLKEKGKRQK